MRCGCRVLPPPLEISTNPQNQKPHKPSAQHPCPSPQCRPHHTCCTQQKLHLTLQCPMTCSGLATHALAGLCALWLSSAASSFGSFHKPAKPQPPESTCTATLPQPPAQAPPPLLHTAEAAFDFTLPHGMPRAGHSHTGRVLCAVVAECCLLLWNSPHTGKTATPTNHLHITPAAAAPRAGPTTPAAHSRGCILTCSAP